MTTPVAHGYPDWGRQSAKSDIEVLIMSGVSISGVTLSAVKFVGNMSYLYVRCSSASSMNVGISWFADEAATLSLFGDVVTTASGGDAVQCVPIRGPWVRFTFERGAYPGTINFQAYMTDVPFNVYAGTDGENNLIDVNATVVGAGATSTFNAIATRGNWVYWRGVLEAATSARILLLSVDFTGTTHLIDYANQDLASSGRMVLVPALPLRVTVFNNDGVGRDAFVSVVHHPFYP